MIYGADLLLPLSEAPIVRGAVRVENSNIIQVGPFDELTRSGEPSLYLENQIILPGLINCHTHLELGGARHQVVAKGGFPMWVTRLQNILKDWTQSQYRESLRLGALECLRYGITTVVDVANSHEALEVLPTLPIRSFSFRECIGLDPNRAKIIVDQVKTQIEKFNQDYPLQNLCTPSLCLHAPYSCSPELIQMVYTEQQKISPLNSIHLAESPEEMELFFSKGGMLWEFCNRRYPGNHFAKAQHPLDYLLMNEGLPIGSLVVHGNYLGPSQFQQLAERKCTLVHCPRSHEFFQYMPFAYDSCTRHGLGVVFGTDSLASNENLNLFDELALFKKNFPQVSSESILKMATVQAGRALGNSQLGHLSVGALADFISIKLIHDPDANLYDEIVCEGHDVSMVVVGGQEVFRE